MKLQEQGRRAHVDFARCGLMIIGIPYHAALLFQSEVTWFVSVYNSSAVTRTVASFIHLFRMPAFFLISGYLAAFALRRYNGRDWLVRRYIALGIPLIFGLAFLHPIQSVLTRMANNVPLTSNLLLGNGIGHLWFLIAILFVCSVAYLLYEHIANAADWSRMKCLVVTLVVFVVSFVLMNGSRYLIEVSGLPGRSALSAAIVGGLSGLPFFIIGMFRAMRADSSGVSDRAVYVTTTAFTLILIIFATLLRIEGKSLLEEVAAITLAVPVSILILEACKRANLSQSGWISAGVRSSFTIYLVHHPIVIALGVISARSSIHWLVHYLCICFATAGLSFLVWLCVKEIPVLGMLLGAGESTKARRRRLTLPALQHTP